METDRDDCRGYEADRADQRRATMNAAIVMTLEALVKAGKVVLA